MLVVPVLAFDVFQEVFQVRRLTPQRVDALFQGPGMVQVVFDFGFFEVQGFLEHAIVLVDGQGEHGEHAKSQEKQRVGVCLLLGRMGMAVAVSRVRMGAGYFLDPPGIVGTAAAVVVVALAAAVIGRRWTGIQHAVRNTVRTSRLMIRRRMDGMMGG